MSAAAVAVVVSLVSCTNASVTVFGKYVAQQLFVGKETFIALAPEGWPRKYLVKRCAWVGG